MNANVTVAGHDEVPAGRRRRVAEGLADFVDGHALLLYGLVVAGLVAMFVVAARLLTLESDEAQILLSSAQAFGIEVPVTVNFGKPTITTGGPHLLVHGLLAHATMDVFAHRLVSLAAAAGLLVLIYRTLRRLGHSAGRAAAGLALFAATPGFIMQAGLAMGEVIATLFMIAAGIHWVRRGVTSWPGAAMTGLLLGTACATRVTCAAAIPGLALYALLTPRSGDRAFFKMLLAAGVAGLVAGASVGAYYLSTLVISAKDAQGYLGATGLDAAKPFGRMIRSIWVLNEYLPFMLLAAIIGGWAIVRSRDDRSPSRVRTGDVAGILLFMGLAMLGAWLLLAPIPHLRYLWPALPCIWLAGIVLLLGEWRTGGSGAARLTLHGIVLGTGGYALVAGFLAIANSESLTIAYQAMGMSPRVGPPSDERFHAGADQRRLARFVAQQDPGARFFMPTIGFSFPIGYLSGRRIQPTGDADGRSEGFMLISPPDYTVWHPEPRLGEWLRLHTRLAFRSGGYAAFRIMDGALPPQGRFTVGQSDFFDDRIDRCPQCAIDERERAKLSPIARHDHGH